jgi:hypothetical protein
VSLSTYELAAKLKELLWIDTGDPAKQDIIWHVLTLLVGHTKDRGIKIINMEQRFRG